MRMREDTLQSCVIICSFLEERGDERRIVNHISKELRKIKTSQRFFCAPLFPSCVYQSFSNIPSMSSGSLCSGPRAQLMAFFRSFSLSCERALQLQHFRPALRFRGCVCGVQEQGWGFSSAWWKCCTNLRGQWPKTSSVKKKNLYRGRELPVWSHFEKEVSRNSAIYYLSIKT